MPSESPNTFSSCSTSPNPSAATTSKSDRKQPGGWLGLPAARPCPTPLNTGLLATNLVNLSLGLSRTSWRQRNVHCSFSDKFFWQLWRDVLWLRKSIVSRCKRSLCSVPYLVVDPRSAPFALLPIGSLFCQFRSLLGLYLFDKVLISSILLFLLQKRPKIPKSCIHLRRSKITFSGVVLMYKT